MTTSKWVAALLLCCGCEECLAPPAFTDQRRVNRDEACARYERALREKCGETLHFDCDAYLGASCSEDQRATDVERCERLIDRARTCQEALDQTCGTDCSDSPIPGQ